MNWKTKLVGERLISVLPMNIGLALHRKMQSWFTRVHIDNEGARRDEIDRAITTWQYLAATANFKYVGSQLLEVGTGWHGSDVIMLHVLGAREIWTCDLLPHLDGVLMKWMLEGVQSQVQMIAAIAGDSTDAIARRVDAALRCDSREAFLKHANIRYIAPCMFHRIDLPESYFDLFYSYSVLQRVPPHHLVDYLRVGRRAVRDGGFSLHVIHHVDHNARHDHKLNPLNYLRYGFGYELLQSKRFNYQNRIRHADFVDLFEHAGFRTIQEETSAEDLCLIEGFKPAKRFRHLPPEDLVITRTQLLSCAV